MANVALVRRKAAAKAETALRGTSAQLEASRLPCEDCQKNSCAEQPLSRARLSVELGSTKQGRRNIHHLPQAPVITHR